VSSISYDAPLRVKPKPSPFLGLIFSIIHFGAVLIVLIIAIPFWLALILSLIAVASGAHAIRRHAMHVTDDAIELAIMEANGDWYVKQKSGKESSAQLIGDSFVSLYLVVLNFQLETGKRSSLILIPGMLSEDEFRQLRIRLKLSKKDKS
jgi:toxin CptA